MKGVENVETELKSSKVTVTGTMDPENLVEYVYQRTKKQAKIVPQPEPAPATEETKEADEQEKQKNDKPAQGKTEDEKESQEVMSKEGVEHYYKAMRLEEEYTKKMRIACSGEIDSSATDVQR